MRTFWPLFWAHSVAAILVHKSVDVGALVQAKRLSPQLYQTIHLEVDPSSAHGFLILLENTMDMNGENCRLIDALAKFELNERNISFGCFHYLVHYAEAPLKIRIIPALFEPLKPYLKLRATAVRLVCSEKDMRFKQCPNHRMFCISRSLFCDGNDNCGMGVDEQNCAAPSQQIALSIVDNRNHVHLAVILGSLAVVTFFTGVASIFVYRWYQRARRGYCSKYVKNMFGAKKKEPSNYEAEETVALLTLGLKNLYLPLPGNRRLSHYAQVKAWESMKRWVLLTIFVNLVGLGFVDCKDATQFLKAYGYLPKEKEGQPQSMMSPDSIKLAIKELQRIGGIKQTGEMDERTLQLLDEKRCGLGDEEIVRTPLGRRRLRRAMKNSFVWPNKTVSYRVVNAPRTIPEKGYVRRALYEATNTWNDVSELQLQESASPDAHIQISFMAGPHGDQYPFDGRDSVLAHAFYPGESTGGDIHFDDDENWGFMANPMNKEINLRIVAAHEVGHSLGLFHSDHPESIMYPYYRYDDARNTGLHYYDKIMLQGLYGRGDHPVPTPEEEKIKTTTATTTTRRTRTRPPQTSTRPPNKEIDICDTNVDAVGVFRSEIFMFKDDMFWRLDQKGDLIEKPRKIKDFWPSLPTPVDACFEINDQAHFFVSQTVYTFYGHELNYTRRLTDLGIPEYVTNIRLAYDWQYGLQTRYYLWSDDEYWKLEENSWKVEVDYPRKIDNNWKNIPDSVSAAFSWDKACKSLWICCFVRPPTGSSKNPKFDNQKFECRKFECRKFEY
uniref:ZnMc domain-containing protein n=1 Tax=Bursaphelenchus xylophilus TaxID=6326 RepID=A0A1I7SQH7_BURXY